MTGRAPYEEILESLQCPVELRTALNAVWMRPPPPKPARGRGRGGAAPTGGGDDVYAPIRVLLDGEDDPGDSVLHHTLYRFLCLFGRPDEADDESGSSGGQRAATMKEGEEDTEDEDAEMANGVSGRALVAGGVCENEAWRAVASWLDTAAGKKTFAKDRAQWSIFRGRQKVLVEAQRRMALLPGRCGFCLASDERAQR